MGCTPLVGNSKPKRSVTHKRESCSKKSRYCVVKAERPAESTSSAGASGGSSAAAAAAGAASGAAAHHGEGVRLGTPVAEQSAADDAVAAAVAASGAE